MVVTHNLTAANSSRMLGITSGLVQKTSEKLASGYQINRAADDAAGLAISEKMRAQIRGLNRASTNALDGISLIQTAEGALNEVHSMLHRMNELATQAANDTNTDMDRSQIQKELDQLKSEIDDISKKTNFNTKPILSGNNTKDASGATGANLPGDEGKLSYYTAKDKLAGVFGSEQVDPITGIMDIGLDAGGTSQNANALFMVDFIGTGLNAMGYNVVDQDFIDRAGNTLVDFMGLAHYTRPDGSASNISAVLSAFPDDATKGSLSISEIMGYLHRVDAASQAAGLGDVGVAGYVDGFDGVSEMILKDYGENIKTAKVVEENGKRSLYMEMWSDVNEPNKYMLQVGSLSGQGIEISVDHMNARRLGITGCRVDDFETAGHAMKSVQDAIDIVSGVRANLGAQQNRLEHTIANLDNAAENTQAAESRIRDTDMAKAMVEFTKGQILQQAGQTILAQANTSTQGVLALLG